MPNIIDEAFDRAKKSYINQTMRLLWLWIKTASHFIVSTLQKGFELFKKFVVNTLPTKVFVKIARVLPVGDWFKYEDREGFYNTSSLAEAIKRQNWDLTEEILNTASKDALYEMLSKEEDQEEGFCSSPIQIATIKIEGQRSVWLLKRLLESVEPEKRLGLLNGIKIHNEPYIFSLVCKTKKQMSAVINALPECDRYAFINVTKSSSRITPLIKLGISGESEAKVKVLISACPKEHLQDYLCRIDYQGSTALAHFAYHRRKTGLNYLLSLIPEENKMDFFKLHDQGMRAALNALGNKNKNGIMTLKDHGLEIQESWEIKPGETFREHETIFDQMEGFKKILGSYPHQILGLADDEKTLTDIKRKYRTQMLLFHPDKNGDSNAYERSQNLNLAYGFYTKNEERQKYSTKL